MSAVTHPLRRYYQMELVVIGFMTPWFLLLAPKDGVLYMTMAAGFCLYVALESYLRRGLARPSLSVEGTFPLRHWSTLLALTVVMGLLFYGYGINAVTAPPQSGHLLGAVAVYLPWALLQQIIFLGFLLNRLQALVPGVRPGLLAMLNGTLYGVVHWPDGSLMLLTALSGSLWAYYYLHARRFWPVVLSHAALAVSYYSWVVGRDLYAEWLARL